MREELLWSLLGGVIATVFNIIYNYVRETRNRRWSIAAEVCGSIDFYYECLVKARAHLESVFDDNATALTAEEWRSIQMDSSPLFIDEQKIRASVDIVFGVESYESNQFEEVFKILKDNLSLALSISNKEQWEKNKEKLRDGANLIARIRPEYRKKLVQKASLWPILTSKVN
ncbi:MAG: hypothetical protein AB2728_19715 [Candidatus Thiodiazotropha sp.]|nr:hypothetical protein [Candidatus Thiodiazotropha sp. (ex Codakia orbicularis)]